MISLSVLTHVKSLVHRKVNGFMNTRTDKNGKGFTIIEVVLVLAIAGLIFLMVFIALPALQRNQRDTQRRGDAATFMSQLESYATNNRGSYPADAADVEDEFLASYLKGGSGGDFNDPKTGDPYTVDEQEANTKQFQYGGRNTQCEGERIANGGGNRSVAIRIQLEGSGYFCQATR